MKRELAEALEMVEAVLGKFESEPLRTAAPTPGEVFYGTTSQAPETDVVFQESDGPDALMAPAPMATAGFPVSDVRESEGMPLSADEAEDFDSGVWPEGTAERETAVPTDPGAAPIYDMAAGVSVSISGSNILSGTESAQIDARDILIEELMADIDNDADRAGVIRSGSAETASVPTRGWRARDALFYLFLAALVVGAYFIFGGSERPQNFLGYSAFSVLSGSMTPDIPEGALVIVKVTPADEIEIGDVITYRLNETETVTHRVVEIHENYNDTGLRGFVTKGTANRNPDNKIIHPGNVLGVVKAQIPVAGKIIQFIAKKPYYLIIPAALLIALFSVLRYLRRSGKKGRTSYAT